MILAVIVLMTTWSRAEAQENMQKIVVSNPIHVADNRHPYQTDYIPSTSYPSSDDQQIYSWQTVIVADSPDQINTIPLDWPSSKSAKKGYFVNPRSSSLKRETATERSLDLSNYIKSNEVNLPPFPANEDYEERLNKEIMELLPPSVTASPRTIANKIKELEKLVEIEDEKSRENPLTVQQILFTPIKGIY